jgi:uncharacterized membrane protein
VGGIPLPALALTDFCFTLNTILIRVRRSVEFAMRWIANFLVFLFLVGAAGSAVVILLTFIEDFRDIFSEEEQLPRVSSETGVASPRSQVRA